ncbi:hypothetical protein G6F60_008742 [Rhizopus arrhizus]|uniref:Uncharacterized protein n=1 Tax=Rhizopus oryzae TaxID=64495 RepID=A0A9P6X4N0_RHIOR|nr:hypothetical protein G6F64_008567 [Rhizopus arrhizus]KAG1397845.1 hypothetical protein G6F60_008742 [Rhizopus arrhizus]
MMKNFKTLIHRKIVTQVIGNKALTQIINQHQPEQYHKFDNKEWTNLKLELQKVYAEQKTNGLRLLILEKRESIYRSLPYVSRRQSLTLEVCHIFEYLQDQVDDDSEDVYSSTWKYILAVLFRGSGAESTYTASKIDKAVNLQDNSEQTKGLMRSRMDLIISGNMVNDQGNEEVFEFGSIAAVQQLSSSRRHIIVYSNEVGHDWRECVHVFHETLRRHCNRS